MKQILIVYYSQSGSVTDAVTSFIKFLKSPDVDITWECIKPKIGYPYPWKIYQFFDIFPECINGETPEIYSPQFDQSKKFDLIILAYQVWFLAPSLPIQAFLKSEYAQVLKDTKVITLIVCRNMWHSASEAMKKMIIAKGGIHIDNVVITHQGNPLLTFITTPRLLLTGKKNKFLGILPPAGVREEEIKALSRFGQAIMNNLENLSNSTSQPLLNGLDAVKVNKRYVMPEIIGHFLYRPWAKLARLFGKQGSWSRRPIIYLFALQLVLAIPIVLPLSWIVQILLFPILNKKLEDYTAMLQSPSEGILENTCLINPPVLDETLLTGYGSSEHRSI